MKWKVFIVYHKTLYPNECFYLKDEKWNSEHWTGVKVGDRENPMPNNIEIKKLPNYKYLGAHYAEAEAIYNLYKNPETYAGLDYIGFTQYDKPNKLKGQEVYNITELITENLSPENHISFETFTMAQDFGQNILMDDMFPDRLNGEGKNAYLGIIDDYNKFHGTEYSLSNTLGRKINLCSSFLVPVINFEKIMKFISHIIESGKLDKYDSKRVNRIQGGLLERYFGIALMFEDLKLIDLSTEHINLK